ncbi:MAG: efflux RND transporter periplasmic adaptor subunit [Candidatus Krumholzibacteriia bacterium]
MKKRIVMWVIVGLIAGLAIGRGCVSRGAPAGTEKSAAETGGIRAAAKAQIWTCAMHPQIRQPKPGKCPICGMDLIPVANDSAAETDQPRQIALSPAARKLAEVAVAPVERRSVAVEIRMVGKVQFDETRLAYIAPRVSGRIDRLYANFTGMPVKAGDRLADMYSPELVSAQQELLLAVKSSGGAAASSSLLDATRERLRLWDLTVEQIAEIERSGQVRDHVTFYSPIGGIVVEKEAREGLYVEAGMRIFTVADLSNVWVQLDAYESDLAWLRSAQSVAFQAEAYPGETFKGTITFISPLLDPMTRTVKVRVNAPNADGRLKPEMFVRAVVQAAVAGNGKAPADLPLVIPASAPLVTGKRAVVYVALPGKEGVYEGRDVVLGPRAGDYFVVLEGLQEGELVVINGNFKIDSSLQLQGKPSMMAPEGGAAPVGHQHGEAPPAARPATKAVNPPTGAAPEVFRKQLGGVLNHVLTIADALADGNLEASLAGASQARQALAAVDMSVLTGDAHVGWMQSLNALKLSLDKMATAKEIESFRTAFASLSPEMANAVKTFGPVRSEPIYYIRCPMAFDNRGATWLQKSKTVRNPYFGKAMPTCGKMIETIPSDSSSTPAGGGHTHE